MTVQEAIEELQKLPKDLDIYIDGEAGPYTIEGFKLMKLSRSRAALVDLADKIGEPVVVVREF